MRAHPNQRPDRMTSARDAWTLALALHGARFVGVHDGKGVGDKAKTPANEDHEDNVQAEAINHVTSSSQEAPRPRLSLERRAALAWARLWLGMRKLQALPRVLFTALRPYWLAGASVFVLGTLVRRWRKILEGRSRWHALQWIVLLDVTIFNELRWIAADPVHRLDWLGHGANQTQPGLYRAKNFGGSSAQRRMTKILHHCESFAAYLGYRAPSWMLQGDLRTVVPTISYRPKPLMYTRFSFVSRHSSHDPHRVTLDMAFPDPERVLSIQDEGDVNGNEDSRPVVLLMAGVGGDSNAPYMRDLVAACTSRGWTACVLLARGLGSSLDVPSVGQLFNPADTGDVLDTMALLHEVEPQRPILLAGISMGAIALCNVLGRHADEIPASVAGCVAVSGGFKCDMLHWARYEAVYQPLIVSEILGEVVARYGHDFEGAGLNLDTVAASRTYTDLFTNFFSILPPPARALDAAAFTGWKAAQEGVEYRRNIRVPLLLFAASDDPLHHPDLIGVETREYRFDNPNVVYLLTSEGGHVGWPTSAWPSDFNIICDVTTRFLHASLDAR